MRELGMKSRKRFNKKEISFKVEHIINVVLLGVVFVGVLFVFGVLYKKNTEIKLLQYRLLLEENIGKDDLNILIEYIMKSAISYKGKKITSDMAYIVATKIIHNRERYAFDEGLLVGLIQYESAQTFNPSIINESSGATGLMQLMPFTAELCASKMKLSTYNLNSAQDNIDMGSYYLNHLLNYFGNYTRALNFYGGFSVCDTLTWYVRDVRSNSENYIKYKRLRLENDEH